jgi:hypothetical protein
VSKVATELVMELQIQLGLILAHVERGEIADGGRIKVEIPTSLLLKAREALDASYGREVAVK